MYIVQYVSTCNAQIPTVGSHDRCPTEDNAPDTRADKTEDSSDQGMVAHNNILSTWYTVADADTMSSTAGTVADADASLISADTAADAETKVHKQMQLPSQTR